MKVKSLLLAVVPPGVVTVTVPVAPLPTDALIMVELMTKKDCTGVPPMLTACWMAGAAGLLDCPRRSRWSGKRCDGGGMQQWHRDSGRTSQRRSCRRPDGGRGIYQDFAAG